MDSNNAYLDIQAGSGGTEAQDWAEMLLRMYLRWGEQKDFKTELVEVSGGEVAGIKVRPCTLKVNLRLAGSEPKPGSTGWSENHPLIQAIAGIPPLPLYLFPLKWMTK